MRGGHVPPFAFLEEAELPSASGDRVTFLCWPKEKSPKEMAIDQRTPRVDQRPGIFRQDIPVLSKNGGRRARRPMGLRLDGFSSERRIAMRDQASGPGKWGQVHFSEKKVSGTISSIKNL